MFRLTSEIREFLDFHYDHFNRPEFMEADPIQIPHLFTRTEDIEIAGFLTATLSWGQRKTIIAKSGQLMTLMDNQPFSFIMEADEACFSRFENFCHRTFNTMDTLYFLYSLKHIYTLHGGLRKVFEQGFQAHREAAYALTAFRNVFFELEYPARTQKHVPDITRGASAKRLNMFLRWMVRRDNRGVDFGIWTGIDPAWLKIPLDVHTGAMARKLGLLNRKQNDWQAVCELTSQLQQFDLSDPVKYDFALFGIGASTQQPAPHQTILRKTSRRG